MLFSNLFIYVIGLTNGNIPTYLFQTSARLSVKTSLGLGLNLKRISSLVLVLNENKIFVLVWFLHTYLRLYGMLRSINVF